MARICVIRQGRFSFDPRVRREVDALLAAGHEVDVLCLSRPGEPRLERSGRLTVRHLPVQHAGGGLILHLYNYFLFWLLATVTAGLLHLRRRYDVVQVNSMPDALVFAAIIPRLFGARVVLDLHECMPEFFSTKFGTGMRHPAVRLVSLQEQASIRFADHVLTCTAPMRDAFVRRGASSEKISVILNGSDEQTFDPKRYSRAGGKKEEFVLVSHGTIEERYGLDTIIRAVALLREEIPTLRFKIYGEGSQVGALRQLAKDLTVEDRVWFSPGFVPMEELVHGIASADVGVVAMKRDAFRDLTLCNKMSDFITMRKPVITSRTRSVETYFDESCFLCFESDDEYDLAEAIRRLYAEPELAARLVQRAAEVNEAYRWHRQSEHYLTIISRLVASRGSNNDPRLTQTTAANDAPGMEDSPLMWPSSRDAA